VTQPDGNRPQRVRIEPCPLSGVERNGRFRTPVTRPGRRQRADSGPRACPSLVSCNVREGSKADLFDDDRWMAAARPPHAYSSRASSALKQTGDPQRAEACESEAVAQTASILLNTTDRLGLEQIAGQKLLPTTQ